MEKLSDKSGGPNHPTGNKKLILREKTFTTPPHRLLLTLHRLLYHRPTIVKVVPRRPVSSKRFLAQRPVRSRIDTPPKQTADPAKGDHPSTMATQEFTLLCLENPLLDIQGKGDQAMLEKYGMKLNDTLLAEPSQMGLYEDLIQNHDAKLIPGGAAQNTARGAQYMLPPDSVWYIGAVGKDEYADTLRQKCKEQGLRVEYHVDEKEPTGCCGVIITDYHRSMCTHLAAANEYKIEHLKSEKIWSMVQKSSVYYVGGYHLTVCVPAAMALAKEAAAKNKIYMLSLSAGFIPQFFKDAVAEVFPYCDYVFGNENEATTWAETQGHTTKSIPEIAKLMAQMPKENIQRPRIVIVTQGTDPTVVAISKAGSEAEVKEYPVSVIEKSEINDTNGAGDAFAGGLCAGVVQEKPLEECIRMGHWLARLSLKELGPSYPFPKQTYSS